MTHTNRVVCIRNKESHVTKDGRCVGCWYKGGWHWAIGGLVCGRCGHLIPLEDIRFKMVEAGGQS